MGKTIAEEYIIKITPELDRKQLEIARKGINDLFSKDQKNNKEIN